MGACGLDNRCVGRMGGPLTLNRSIILTDTYGNESTTKERGPNETIQGTIERNRRIQSGDSHDQVEYQYVLFTSASLILGDKVDNREVVADLDYGEYGLS